MRCIVIGAGIIGTTVAWRLAQRGDAVTLLDRAVPGAGTSSTTFAWVNASGKDPCPRAYYELNSAGMAAHRRLAAEFGDAPWLVPTGALEWETSPAGLERLAARARRLADWDYNVRHLTRHEVERLEPDLLLGPDAQEVIFYPDEAHIFPSIYIACLLRAAGAHGTVLRANTDVVEIATTGGRASGVVTRSGERLDADAVICCCGRWTPDILRSVGADLPLISPAPAGSEAVGLLVRTAAVVADVRRVLLGPSGLAMRPDGGGHLLLHSDVYDRAVSADLEVSPATPTAIDLLWAARPLVRHMQQTPIDSAVIGIRPIPADGFSAVGRVASVDGLYVIVTHSGVTLAPILAELAASEVHGAVERLLEPFRPDRFL